MSGRGRFIVKKTGDEQIGSAIDFSLKMIQEVYGRGLNPVWDYDLLHFEEMYLRRPGNAFFTAYNEKEKIVGSLAVRRYNGRIKALEGLCGLTSTAELAKCFVDRECRRAGIGSLLVREAEQFCRSAGYKIIYLHTHQFLPGAPEFWLSQGFRVILEEEDPQQTVHMEKVIYQNCSRIK
ncbi:MAG: GNAT family N-acetyltransferase [Firmicutes bacterium]|nr:GNAT family N-acetyltransferase [Bacillota bacterium]